MAWRFWSVNKSPLGRYKRATFLRVLWRTGVAVIAVGYALLEAGLLFFEEINPYRIWFMVLVLVVALLSGCYRGFTARRQLLKYRVAIDQEHSIMTMVGDLFENLEARPGADFVFGANAQFSTSGLIPDSVHAGFLEYLSHDGKDPDGKDPDGKDPDGKDPDGKDPDGKDRTAQDKLDKAMKEIHLDIWEEDGVRRKVHDLGTIVSQPFNDKDGVERVAYLFANSIMGVRGYRGGGATLDVLDSIWEFRLKHTYRSSEIIFPLIGTGEAKDFKKTKAVTNLIDAYFARLENAPRSSVAPVGNLVLSIQPGAVEQGEINLEAVHRYMLARTAVFNS